MARNPTSRRIESRAKPLLKEKLLRPAEVARALNVSMRCLQEWRIKGQGPRFLRLSYGVVRYRRQDVERWLASRSMQ